MVYGKQLTWIWGFWYNKTCTLYIFLFNTHFYVPIKEKCLSGHMYMYKCESPITPEQILYKKSFLWDMIKFTWDNMRLHMNGHLVDLPLGVFVSLKDKIRACCMVAKNGLDLQFMIKWELTATAWPKLLSQNT